MRLCQTMRPVHTREQHCHTVNREMVKITMSCLTFCCGFDSALEGGLKRVAGMGGCVGNEEDRE